MSCIASSSAARGKPALSWDSYEDLLFAILDEFKPGLVMEFGSGKSTNTIAAFPSVKRLYSVEHDKEWFDKIPKRKNVYGLFRDEYEYYRGAILECPPYDLIFIDGKERQQLLMLAQDKTKLVLLHDADRNEYREFIDQYPYQIWNKAECTVALTFDFEVFNRLEGVYENRGSST